MSKARFLLREPKSEKETLIFLIYRIGDARLKYSTGEKVQPTDWDKTLQRADLTNKTGNHLIKLKSVNRQLERYTDLVEQMQSHWKVSKTIPTTESLYNALEVEFKKKPKQAAPLSFFEFIDDWIKNARYTRTRIRKPLKASVRRKYKATRNKLELFAKADPQLKGKISFGNVDTDFYERFVKYLQTEHQQSENTIGKHIKCLKLFLAAANEAGIRTKQDFRGRFFSAPSEEAFSVYLNESELLALHQLDLTGKKRLDKVRDLFLIGCRTALRFADFTTLQPENFIENKTMLKVQTSKTGEVVVIPVHPWVRQIMDKWEWWLPKAMSNQKMNEYIKELCLLAGITTSVRVHRTRGGKPEEYTIEKYKLVSSHTARRTAASLMYLAGIPPISIMKITGHQSEKVFLKYIKLSPEEHALKMLENPYFQAKPTIQMKVKQDSGGYSATATAGNRFMAARAQTIEHLKAMALEVVNLTFEDRGISYTIDELTFDANI